MTRLPSFNTASQFFSWLLRFCGIYAAVVLIILGALFIGAILIPLRSLFFGTPSIVQSRQIVSAGVRFYLWVLDVSGLLQVEYRGFEALRADEPQLFIANHPSLFDALFFMARFPAIACIVKPSLADYSPYAFVIRWARYLVAGRDDIRALAKEELLAGRPILIFPEGTRSDALADLPHAKPSFQRGAAAIALHCETPLYPVHICVHPPALGKARAWHAIPDRKCQVVLSLQEAIQADAFEEESPQLAARRITAAMEGVLRPLEDSPAKA